MTNKLTDILNILLIGGVRGIYNYLFVRCAYCGKLLRQGGGIGIGTRQVVYPKPNLENPVTQYACLNCEMEFDD